MANLASPLTTYSDTTPQKRQITDVIDLIDPSDAPLVEALGGLDGAADKFRFVNKGDSTTAEWLEDTLLPLTDTITESIASNTTVLTVADGTIYQEGHIILIDSEYSWVSEATSSTTVTVTRNYGGTQASHADNAVVEIVGMARLEGDESDDIAFTDRTVGSNYTQIFHQEVKVSRTHNQLSQYGIAEEMEYQQNKSVPSLMRLVEKNIFHGQRKAGSATTPRGFGGLGTFITDNTVSAGGAVTQADFEDAAELAYTDGGMGPWVAAVSPANMQVVKNLLETSSFLRYGQDASTLGMAPPKRIVTPFGDVHPFLDRWAGNSKIYLIDGKRAGVKTFYPFTAEPLAKTGDYERSQVVAELSLCVKMDKAHAVISAIS
jgi:hypothetical protein